MSAEIKYRWPTKLRKFRIDNPFLKILVAKYENEIPWQVKVRDSDTLIEYIQAAMLSKLRQRFAYPFTKGTKHTYATAADVDLSAALTADHGLNHDELWFIETMRQEEGDVAATEELVDMVNQGKSRAFESWFEFLERKYPENPAFRVLLFRPILELSPRGSRRVVVSPCEDVIEWLHRRIAQETVSPNDNLAKLYCNKLGSLPLPAQGFGWQHVPEGT